MDETNRHFANRCLPLLMANQSAWCLLNTRAVDVSWTGGPSLDSIVISSAEESRGELPLSHFGYGIVTWAIPFLFRTSPGYNLLVRGPSNMPKDGITPLEGLVETDWCPATFTINWKFTRPCTTRFVRGEPLCAVVPQRRYELESFIVESTPLTAFPGDREEYEHWAQSRAEFNQRLMAEAPANAPWQKDYFQGKTLRGNAAAHQTKRTLRDCEESSRGSN